MGRLIIILELLERFTYRVQRELIEPICLRGHVPSATTQHHTSTYITRWSGKFVWILHIVSLGHALTCWRCISKPICARHLPVEDVLIRPRPLPQPRIQLRPPYQFVHTTNSYPIHPLVHLHEYCLTPTPRVLLPIPKHLELCSQVQPDTSA